MRRSLHALRALHWCGLLALAVGLRLAWVNLGSLDAVAVQAASSPESRLRELKITLPPQSKPTNTLVNAVRVGDLLYVSGTGPGTIDGKPIAGRVGQDMDLTQGKNAARLVGLQVLSVVK